MNLRHQIVALAVVPLVIAILTVTTFITWQATNLAQSSIETFERNMLKAKETELLNLTNLARSAIEEVYASADANDQAAKDRVRSILTSLDYGEDGYSSSMTTMATMSCTRGRPFGRATTGWI